MIKLKRTISLIILLFIMLITLTGCVSVDTQFKINNGGSIDATVITMVNISNYKELLQITGVNDLDDEIIIEQIKALLMEEKRAYEEKGYKVEEITDGTNENMGFKAKKRFKNINEMSIETYEAKGLDKFTIDENKGLFKTRQEINGVVDFTVYDKEEISKRKDYAKYFDFKFTLQLPYKTEENNASEISNNGKTLIWNLDIAGLNEIHVIGNKTNILNIIILAAGMIVVVGGAGFTIFTLNKKIKKIEQ